MVATGRRGRVAVMVGAAALIVGAAVVVGVSTMDTRGSPVRLPAEIDHWYRTDEAAGVLRVHLRQLMADDCGRG